MLPITWPILAAQLVLISAALYVFVGLLIAIPFITKGVRSVDPNADQGTWGFRLIVLPGVVALWPFILKKWWHASRSPKSS